MATEGSQDNPVMTPDPVFSNGVNECSCNPKNGRNKGIDGGKNNNSKQTDARVGKNRNNTGTGSNKT